MNMSGDIRVKTESRHKTLYNELKNFVVGDMHELFFICTCLGYKANNPKLLGSNGEDRFWSRTIRPEEYVCYYSMLLEKNNMDISIIKDDKLVLSKIEEYANGGMEILIKEFLSDYLIKSSTELKLDPTSVKELPKTFLSFIYEKIQ